jgi:hypothetical protein
MRSHDVVLHNAHHLILLAYRNYEMKTSSAVKNMTGCILAALLIVSITGSRAEARSNIDFGQDIGFVSATPGGTNFAMQFTMDYHLTKELSIGPMVQFVPPGDFTMVAAALVARYQFLPFPAKCGAFCPSLVPFLGFGGLYTKLERDGLNSTANTYFVPIGVTLEWKLSQSFGFAATFSQNFHDISYGNQFSDDRSSQGAFFGIRFHH